ncbi:MAG: TlpA disulfide reductase family protein [Phycisphaerales bacterium]
MRVVGVSMLGVALALAGCSDADPPLAPSYRVVLQAEGGDLPFQMDLVEGSADAEGRPTYEAVVHNADERVRTRDVRVTHNPLKIVVRFEPYGSTLTLLPDKKRGALAGAWVKPRPEGKVATLMASATSDDADVRFEPHPSGVVNADAFRGRWRIDLGEDEAPGVGVFDVAPDGTATGTIMTPTGDYRYLAGRADVNMMRLSTFDGGHAILVRVSLQDDGSLLGDTSWGNWALQTWSAARDDQASLPDPASIATIIPDISIDHVTLRTLDGRETTLRAAVAGLGAKATLVLVFGSWCSNSADLTEDVKTLLAEHKDEGLGVVGLAYEYAGETERDAPRVEAYRIAHGVTWPIFLAGLSDKDKASHTLPIIDKVHAFPTLIFLNASGDPVRVLTGYNGPATGTPHELFLSEAEAEIDKLLAADPG